MTVPSKTWKLGVVSYLNSRPLIEGLDRDPSIRLFFDVPSRLPGLLERGDVDVALVPIVELVTPGRRWRVISDACIGCDGETLTVRVFSRVPPESIRRLHIDGDSRTSVVLAQIIWRELFDRTLELVRFRGDESADEYEAVLLIGDKVVNHSLVDHDIETDLGSCWKSLTGLPFVFAAWAGPKDQDFADLERRLSAARDAGMQSAELIAEDFGPGLNWPLTLAKRYLTKRLKFILGPRQREGLQRFFELARRHNLVDAGKELLFA